MAQVIGTVSKLVGKVFARAEDGSLRELRVGDQVFQGETLVTAQGAVVEITAPDAPPVVLSGDRELLLTGEMAVASRDMAEEAALADDTLDAVVAALEGEGDLLDGLEETAAGGTAGDEGSSFVRLGRIGFDLGASEDEAAAAPVTGSKLDTSKADNDLQLLDNEDPNAGDDEFSAEFGTPVSGDVFVNDSDADGDTLTVTGNTDPDNGAVVVNEDGTFTYTPNEGFSGEDSFTYSIDDGNGGTDTATVTITVGEDPTPPPPPPPANEAPDAVDDVFSGDFGETLTGTVLDNDSDPDGDPLTVVANTDPSNGSVVVNEDGTFTYTPNEGFSGEDSFTYSIDDGNGGTDTATVTITVGEDPTPPPPPPPANEAPDAVNDVFDTEFDTAISGQVLTNDSDPENDPLSVVASTQPASGTLEINPDGTFTYTPDAGFSGSDSFSYVISDGEGGEDTATVVINVAEQPNEAPDAVDDGFSTAFELPVAGSVLGNDSDPEGDPLVVVGNTDPANGTVSVGPAGNFVYTPNPGFSGEDSFTYTIDDGNGGTDTATVTVTVEEPIRPPVNNFPDAVDDTYTTDFGVAVAGTVTSNDQDPDGDTLTVISNSLPTNGVLNLNSDGTFTYTPNEGFSGNDSFVYTVADGNGGTDSAQVTITVAPDPNLPPTAGNDTVTSEVNQPVTVSILDNDADPDGSLNPASITIVSGPADGALVVNADGTVTYTPFDGYTGTDSFSYTVADNEGAVSNVATVDISVRDFGEFSVADTEVIEGGLAVITITRSGDALDEAEVTVSTLVPSGSDTAGVDDFVAGSQVLTFAPGVTSLTFTVATNDDALLESAETFRVELTDPTGGAVVSATNGEGTVTILDNDSANVVIGDAQTEEGSSAVFSVTLTQASDSPTDIRFNAGVEAGNTAESDDFDAAGLVVTYDDGSGSQSIPVNGDGSFTIPAGITDLEVSVPTTDDDVFEGDETFTLSATVDAGAIDTSDVGIGTISDDGSQPDGDDENDTPDDDRPAFSINDVAVNEDDGTITFTVELTGDTEVGASVQYVVGEDSAIEPEDYAGDSVAGNGIDALAGVLNFAPGVTQQTITLAVNDDALNEGVEQFTVTLANAVNAVIADAEGVGTINDEAAPDSAYTLQLFAVVDGDYVDANSISEDGGTGSYVVLAVDDAGQPLSEQPGGTVSVLIGDTGDTAERGQDYTADSMTLATVGSPFIVTAIDDALADNNEFFTLSIGDDWSREAEFETVTYSSSGVTTTILDETDNDPDEPGDNDTAFTLQVVAADASGNPLTSDTGGFVFANGISEEGETSAHYVVVALDASGNLLSEQPTGTVDVAFTNIDAESEDYSASTAGSVAIGEVFSTTAVDDVLADNGESFFVSLAADPNFSNEDAYEAVNYSGVPVTTTITDETGDDPEVPENNDTALVAISGEYTIEEGDTSGLFTVAVDQPADSVTSAITVALTYSGVAVDGSDFTGVAEVEIPVGSNSVSFTLDTLDDALAEGSESLVISLGAITDSNFEAIAVDPANGSVTSNIVDESVPDVAYNLQVFAVVDGADGPEYTSATTIAEDGGVAEYVVLAVDNDGQPLPSAEQPGGTVTVNVGDASDTADRGDDYTSSSTISAAIGVAFTIAAVDDVYADSGETFSLSLADDWSEAGDWEAVNYATAPVVTTLVDDSDTTTLTLNALTLFEGTNDASVSATLSAAPTDAPVVITLENGATVTFGIGQTTANSTPFAVQGDDVYRDGETFTLDATLTSGGGEFENLVVDGDVTVTVSDTVTPVTVNLSASDVDEGGSVTITATLDAAFPAEARDQDITLFLSNGGLLVIPQGENTGSVTLSVSDVDDAYINGDREYEISAAGARGGSEFELFQPGTPAIFSVVDNGTVTTVTLSADDVSEDDAGVTFTAALDNPAQGEVTITTDLGDITIADGQSTGTLFVATRDSDVYLDATSLTATVTAVSGGNFEAVDFSGASATAQISDEAIGTTTVTLSSSDVVEGEDITVSASVDNAPQTDLTLTLNNGETILIDAGTLSGSVTFANPNTADAVADAETLTYSITDSAGGNYEDLDIGDTVEVVVSDGSAPPVAVDDPGTGDFSIVLGSFDSSGWDNPDSNGSLVSISAFDQFGNPSDVSERSGFRLGVANAARGDDNVPEQIEHDAVSGYSEALVFSFAGYINQAEVAISNLIGGEHGGETGVWIALLDGTVVATGDIDSSSVAIDTGGLVFNELRFEARLYTDNQDSANDSSDYFVSGISATGPGLVNQGYTTTESDTVTVLADNGLLANDSDAEGDAISVVRIDGVEVSSGDVVTLASGALLTINADGSFSYDPNGQFDGLAAGETANDSFTYQIVDATGATLDQAGGEGPDSDGDSVATATVTVVGLGDPYVPPAPPTTDDAAVIGDQDTEIALPTLTGDDPDGELAGFIIKSLPANGVLLVNGVAAAVGDVVSLADAGSLTFVPDSDWSGDTSFEFTALDTDGVADGTAATMNIEVVETAAPIAIDTDGDGVSYLSRDAGVVFTDEETGESVNTAWVGPEDGMLVFDANNSGTVDQTREYVFTEWSDTATTDMEAVAEVFDTNQDGVLDAQDEHFDQFAVWQDADSDGETDSGELVSLTELGVESIALNYREDSEAETTADGDVVVHGQSNVTWSDGDVTVAEDASFAIEAADVIGSDEGLILPAGEAVSSVDTAAASLAESAEVESPNPVGEADAAAMLELDILLTSDNTRLDSESPE